MTRPLALASAVPSLRQGARLAAAGLVGAAMALWAAQGRASEDVIKSYGIATFGTLKYPADYKQLNYVNADAPKGGEISLWAPGTFDSMNPYTRKGRAGALSSMMFESMLTSTADEIGASYCLICTTLEYPANKDWVIFDMNPAAKFADGTPVTAEDALYTYELFLNDGLPSFRAVLGRLVEKAEVLSPLQIKFTFKADAPRRDVIESVGGLPIFSKKWFVDNKAGLDESRLEPALGSGPYVLDRYDINQRIVYKRNPDYWGKDLPINVGRNNFDSIRIEYFGDSNAAFEGFKSGAYTFRIENSSKTWATGYDFPAIQNGNVIKAELNDGTIATGQSFVMNLRRPMFQDIRVREAIGLMFNFEWSNETLFFGLYERINSFWENSELAAQGLPTDGELKLLQPLVDKGLLDKTILTDEAVMAPRSSDRQLDRKNLRQASKLLEEAGWIVGDDGLRRKDGKTLRIELIDDSPTFDRVINPFIENLRRLGVDAVYNRIDSAQYTDRTRNFDFDIITDQFPMGYEPGSGLKQFFGSETADESVFNAMGLKDPAVDSLIDTIIAAKTKPEMITGVRALDRVLRVKRFWIPQWYKDKHTVAYYNMFEHPDPLPPYSLGYLDFWWVNPQKEAALKASGAF